MSAQKDYVNDVRSTSYNAATANPDGYMGSIDDAIAQIKAEPDEVRGYWPMNMSRERYELLGFLGVLRPVELMSGVQLWPRNVDVTRSMLARLARARVPEDDTVVYGAPEAPVEPGFYTLAYAQKHFPQSFKQ
jgi:hypothetical protein